MKQQMHRSQSAACAAFVLAISGVAWAGDGPDATGTVQINACMPSQASAVEAKLNETCQHMLATLAGPDDESRQSNPASTKAALIEAERA